MTAFKTGVHTIEFKTANQLSFSSLPPAYKGTGKDKNRIIRPEGHNRYVMNVAKLPGMQEYSTPADTQKAIGEAYMAFVNMGAGYPTTTRIDFRFDDHNGRYADHLSVMTVLVNLLAHVGGMFDRRVFFTDGQGVITSVRCMPEDDDHGARYGVEYYDKLRQNKSDAHGYARLELRRLNLDGESVPCVAREWRGLLSSITKRQYLDMLEEHAAAICGTKQETETPSQFAKRVRHVLIAREEETKLYRLCGKTANHYHGDKMNLPKWAEVKSFIDDLTAQLDDALAQPKTADNTAIRCEIDMPF